MGEWEGEGAAQKCSTPPIASPRAGSCRVEGLLVHRSGGQPAAYWDGRNGVATGKATLRSSRKEALP